MGVAPRRSKASWGLAIFVVTALLALIGFAWFLAGLRLGFTCRYSVDFAYAAGLEVGAPIKVSGIKVGQVRGMQLLSSTSQPPAAKAVSDVGRREPAIVRATLAVSAEAKPLMTTGTTLAVVTTGIIGDAFLELAPGVGLPLAPSTALRGVDAPRLHQMALASQTVLQAVAPFFAETEQLLQTHAAEAGKILVHAGAFTQDAAAVMETLRGVLGDGRALQSALDDGAAVAKILRTASPELIWHLTQIVSTIHALLERFNTHLTDAKANSLQQEVTETLTQLTAAVATAQALLLSLQRGEGTLGGLLQDPQIYDDMRDLMHDLREHPYKLLWRR